VTASGGIKLPGSYSKLILARVRGEATLETSS